MGTNFSSHLWKVKTMGVLSLLFLIHSGPSSAENLEDRGPCDPTGCDLSGLFQLSLGATGTGAIHKEREAQARSARGSAYGGFLPDVSLDLVHNYEHSQRIQGWYMPTLSATIHQTIFSGFDDFARVDQAEADLQRIREENGQEKLKLYENLATLYYSFLKTQKLIEKREEALELSKNSLALLYKRNRLGRSKTSELLQEQAYTARLEANLESLLRELSLVRQQLSYYTGLEPDRIKLRLDEGRKFPEAGSINEEASAASRPDVKAAESEVRLAESESFRTAGAFLPEVYVEGEYFFLKDERLSTSSAGKKGWTVEVGVSVPLFSGGERFFERSMMQSKVREAQLVHEALLKSAKMEIGMARVDLERKILERDKYKKARDLARRYYRSIALEADRGMVTSIEVVRARMDLVEMEESFESARFESYMAGERYLTTAGQNPYFSPWQEPVVSGGPASGDQKR